MLLIEIYLLIFKHENIYLHQYTVEMNLDMDMDMDMGMDMKIDHFIASKLVFRLN
jgi:hypothetical protein